ncbi:MAG: hypothetical protein B6242_16345 [Anaerolineaceae bacterium 4572_78]|nr:MAG: hypothetical protein B6242_16345 [Anaerolineaceae bacterium 4572_78]
MTQFLLNPIRLPYGEQANREISPFQVRLAFQHLAPFFNRALHNRTKLKALLKRFFTSLLRVGFKQKRSKRPNAI